MTIYTDVDVDVDVDVNVDVDVDVDVDVNVDVNMKTKQLNLFCNMIKGDYISIHGEKIVAKLFYDLDSEQFNKLIDLYKRFPLRRWNKIRGYLEKEGLISKQLNRSFVVHMYINALQHFLDM
jgi:hypothetical protein